MKTGQFIVKIVMLTSILVTLSSLTVFAAPPSQQNQNVTVTNTTSNPVPVSVTNAGSSLPTREILYLGLSPNGASADVTFPSPVIIELVSAQCSNQALIQIKTSYPVTATATPIAGSASLYSEQIISFQTTAEGILNATSVAIPTTPTTNKVTIYSPWNGCNVGIVYRY